MYVGVIIATILVIVFGLMVAYLRVPPVPTLRRDMDKVFRMAVLDRGETVFDLGAGDGRVVAEAQARGANAIGWELNPMVWLIARLRYGDAVRVFLGDMWKAPVEDADVVFTFLMPKLMPRVEREIWARMKKGSRLISNAFGLPSVRPTKEEAGIYLYIK